MPSTADTLTPEELEQLRSCALGKEVAVGSIESELQHLWDVDDAATRASLMNFAIYHEQLGALLENTNLIAEITREHACRALLIMGLPQKELPRVRAWITAHCRLTPEGKKEACSEQVAFLVEGTNADLIRNIVFAHLDSDLPLVLWWQGDFTSRFEEGLYRMVDRLFVDSTAVRDVPAFCATLQGAFESERSRFKVHDLAWSRSFQMRLAVASAFDDPELLSRLGETRRVSVTASTGQETTAWLLLAWFACQAGWRLTGREEAVARFQAADGGGGEIEAVIEFAADVAPLAAFNVEGDGLSLRLQRETGAEFLEETIAIGEATRVRMLPAGPDRVTRLVADQLMRGGNNQLYRKVFPLFRELAQTPK